MTEKVYFYSINLYEVEGERLCSNTDLRSLIEEMAESIAVRYLSLS